jgi:hypothetical protein
MTAIVDHCDHYGPIVFDSFCFSSSEYGFGV